MMRAFRLVAQLSTPLPIEVEKREFQSLPSFSVSAHHPDPHKVFCAPVRWQSEIARCLISFNTTFSGFSPSDFRIGPPLPARNGFVPPCLALVDPPPSESMFLPLVPNRNSQLGPSDSFFTAKFSSGLRTARSCYFFGSHFHSHSSLERNALPSRFVCPTPSGIHPMMALMSHTLKLLFFWCPSPWSRLTPSALSSVFSTRCF